MTHRITAIAAAVATPTRHPSKRQLAAWRPSCRLARRRLAWSGAWGLGLARRPLVMLLGWQCVPGPRCCAAHCAAMVPSTCLCAAAGILSSSAIWWVVNHYLRFVDGFWILAAWSLRTAGFRRTASLLADWNDRMHALERRDHRPESVN